MGIIAKVRGFLSVCLIWRNIFSFVMYLFNTKEINEDIERYLTYTPFKKAGFLSLNFCMLFIKQFRSVFYYRTIYKKPFLAIFSWIIPKRMDNIEIGGKIGGGLAIYHRQGSCICPHSAGKNLSISQCVTIGKGRPNEEGRTNPVIGDNVSIMTNSVVFGGIDIGDNVIIGAGTVLCKSVPDDCVVVGNPARIIKKGGISCNEKL